MIRHILYIFLLAFTLPFFFSSQLSAKDFITLGIPEEVIVDATHAILPLRLDARSKSVEGEIYIIKISELKLTEGHLTCRLHVAGKNLAIVTEIAGHEIKLRVGNLAVDFKTESAIRFDAKQQTLFIKPIVKDVTSGGQSGGADIGQVLIAVLNGREFPVSIQDLDPLIARAGGKTITINNQIVNIEAKTKSIVLSLVPAIIAD